MTVHDSEHAHPRCLVVEDDPTIAELIATSLRREEFEVDIKSSGEAALEDLRQTDPDVVLLDFELPGISGQQVCRAIREQSDVYIVMVTARNSDLDRVLSLSLGADDYVVKPFLPAELIARVRGLLRRPRKIERETEDSGGKQPNARVIIGDVMLDRHTKMAYVGERSLELTHLEFDILNALVTASPDVLSRTSLLEGLWGDPKHISSHVVDVHVHNLRRKLAAAGSTTVHIQARRGVGYRLYAERAS